MRSYSPECPALSSLSNRVVTSFVVGVFLSHAVLMRRSMTKVRKNPSQSISEQEICSGTFVFYSKFLFSKKTKNLTAQFVS
jgi:hypothetical protein